jgi:hypothetical protein
MTYQGCWEYPVIFYAAYSGNQVVGGSLTTSARHRFNGWIPYRAEFLVDENRERKVSGEVFIRPNLSGNRVECQ